MGCGASKLCAGAVHPEVQEDHKTAPDGKIADKILPAGTATDSNAEYDGCGRSQAEKDTVSNVDVGNSPAVAAIDRHSGSAENSASLAVTKPDSSRKDASHVGKSAVDSSQPGVISDFTPSPLSLNLSGIAEGPLLNTDLVLDSGRKICFDPNRPESSRKKDSASKKSISTANKPQVEEDHAPNALLEPIALLLENAAEAKVCSPLSTPRAQQKSQKLSNPLHGILKHGHSEGDQIRDDAVGMTVPTQQQTPVSPEQNGLSKSGQAQASEENQAAKGFPIEGAPDKVQQVNEAGAMKADAINQHVAPDVKNAASITQATVGAGGPASAQRQKEEASSSASEAKTLQQNSKSAQKSSTSPQSFGSPAIVLQDAARTADQPSVRPLGSQHVGPSDRPASPGSPNTAPSSPKILLEQAPTDSMPPLSLEASQGGAVASASPRASVHVMESPYNEKKQGGKKVKIFEGAEMSLPDSAHADSVTKPAGAPGGAVVGSGKQPSPHHAASVARPDSASGHIPSIHQFVLQRARSIKIMDSLNIPSTSDLPPERTASGRSTPETGQSRRSSSPSRPHSAKSAMSSLGSAKNVEEYWGRVRKAMETEDDDDVDLTSTLKGSTLLSASWTLSTKGADPGFVVPDHSHVDLAESRALVKRSITERMTAIKRTLKTGGWFTCRVFISSTFKDMHGERDCLSKIVFPELNSRCKNHGLRIRFVPIDLRWGLTEEDTSDQGQGALELCLEEIDKCRPWFILLGGDRYGWIPPNYKVREQTKYKWINQWPAGHSITAMEIFYGFLNHLNSGMRALAYFRNPSFMAEVPPECQRVFECESPEAATMLAALRKEIGEYPQCKISEYSCKFGGVSDDGSKIYTGGLKGFAKRVIQDLWEAAMAEFGDELRNPADKLAVETAYHDLFMQARSKMFYGRLALIRAMGAFAEKKDKKDVVMIVTGKPGFGKSALMSSFVKDFIKNHPDFYVLFHFIGASPASVDARCMLQRLCSNLVQRFNLNIEVPVDYDSLPECFSTAMAQAALSKIPILIVIDALNQMSPSYRSHYMDWLPSHIPSGVSIILSTLEGDCYDALAERSSFLDKLFVGPLDQNDCEQLVLSNLSEYGKKLNSNQLAVLLSKTEAKCPLYLTTVCEELRVFGVYEKLSDIIQNLPHTVDDLFKTVLQRLESDYGADLVRNALSVIACSRNGLLESEMLQLLPGLMNLDQPVLPRSVWTRLYRGVEAYLTPLTPAGEGTLAFFHRQLGKAVRDRYLVVCPEKCTTYQKGDPCSHVNSIANLPAWDNKDRIVHEELAECFRMQADPRGDKSWRPLHGQLDVEHHRGLSEVVYHMLQAKMFGEAVDIMCDICYIEVRAEAGMLTDLLTDYNMVLGYTGGPTKEPVVDAFRRFLRTDAHIIAQDARRTLQQALNQPDASPVCRSATADMNIRGLKKPLLHWVNKPQQQDSCLMTIVDHRDSVRDLAFSHDGHRIVTASFDHTAKVWSQDTGGLEIALEGHTSAVNSCDISPDDTKVITGSTDKCIKVWSIESGAVLATLYGHAECVTSCHFSPNGSWVASCSYDGTVRFWDTGTWEVTSILHGHTHVINHVAWSPDSSTVASASSDNSIRFWTPSSRKEVGMIEGEMGVIYAFCHTPDGRRVAIASTDQTIKIMDSASFQVFGFLAGHGDQINDVRFSPDGRKLVSASDDHTARIWDVERFAQSGKGSCILVLEGHSSNVSACDYSPDSRRVVTSSLDCSLIVWNADDGTLLFRLIGHSDMVNACSYSPNGKFIASASHDCTAAIWNASTGSQVQLLRGHQSRVQRVRWHPAGSRLLSCSWDGSLIVWNVKDGSQLFNLSGPDGHQGIVECCTFSPDASWILSGSTDKTLKVWNAETGELMTTLTESTDAVIACEFSPDTRRIYAASKDSSFKVWDTRTWKVLTTLKDPKDRFLSCCFSPDGNRILASSSDKTARVYDIKTHVALLILKGHNAPVNCAKFSSNGQRIVTAGADCKVKIWDATSGNQLASLEGHIDQVTCCLFTTDTSKVITGSNDCTVKVWEPQKAGSSISSLGHSDRINACSFSAEGNVLATASSDHSCKVWNFSGEVVARLEGHDSGVMHCRYLSDGKIISTSQDSTIRMWDGERGGMLAKLEGHAGSVNFVATAPALDWMASASDDCSIRIWSLSQRKAIATLQGHTDKVKGCDVSPDGKWVASCGMDSAINIWSVDTWTLAKTMRGHLYGIFACYFSPNGTKIASAALDNTVKIWDPVAGVELMTLQGHISDCYDCCWFKDGRRLVSTSDDGALKIWDVETGKTLSTLDILSRLTTVHISPDGSRIAVGAEAVIHVYEAETLVKEVTLEGHDVDSAITCCRFSPDGKMIVSSSWDWTIRVWDVESGELVRTMEGHSDQATGCCFAPDSSMICTVSADGTVKVWSAEHHNIVQRLEGHDGGVTACAWSPDSRKICTASKDKTLIVWRVSDWAPIAQMQGHEGMVNTCAFSPDSRMVVSGSEDTKLKVWSASFGDLIKTLEGHRGAVRCCMFSPSGDRIVSSADDGYVTIWSSGTWQEIFGFQEHKDTVQACAFSPDGSRIVSASFDKSIRVWDAQTGNVICSFICRHLVTSVAVGPLWPVFAAGDCSGTVYLLQLMDPGLEEDETRVPSNKFSVRSMFSTESGYHTCRKITMDDLRENAVSVKGLISAKGIGRR